MYWVTLTNQEIDCFCINTAFLDNVRTVKWHSNSYVHEDKHQSVQSKNITQPYSGKKETKFGCLNEAIWRGTDKEWY